ncbi:hypothetical protein Vafri_18216 [Volvox africanus]|uniref:Uncharacterized protein n=1 Tax=Volvox africanus TaxID=51714 RepID=A0A8J4BS77_9CHLO|nr:hypothetical protein Vafri_18216 [Volvox africanus]
MGTLTAAISLPQQLSTRIPIYSDVVKRWKYSGEVLAAAKAVSGAANGGDVLIGNSRSSGFGCAHEALPSAVHLPARFVRWWCCHCGDATDRRCQVPARVCCLGSGFTALRDVRKKSAPPPAVLLLSSF